MFQLRSAARLRLAITLGLAAFGCLACGRSEAPEATLEASSVPEEVVEATAETAFRRVPRASIPLLIDDGDRASLRVAAERSLGWLRRQSASRTFVVGPRTISAASMAEVVERLLGWLDAGLDSRALAAEMAYAFDAFEAVGRRDGKMLVTGYYEPILEGSFTRRPGYDVPLYRPPSGLVRVDLGAFADDLAGRRLVGRLIGGRLEPYPDRKSIREQRVLAGRELAWVRDPIDAFFLEVQGSGSLRLPDGRLVRVGYAGANGRSYRSVGALLIDEGKVAREVMSMQAIRAYLEAHPHEVDRVFDHNLSKVFFRRLDGPPLGSLGVPVTPGRSIATDHRLFPRGGLGFLISDVPRMASDGTTEVERPLRRFVLNQDTGGAIRGPGRVDYFWGRGPEAGERAGVMKQPGRLIFLVPREARDPAGR